MHRRTVVCWLPVDFHEIVKIKPKAPQTFDSLVGLYILEFIFLSHILYFELALIRVSKSGQDSAELGINELDLSGIKGFVTDLLCLIGDDAQNNSLLFSLMHVGFKQIY